jgi:peptidoglycan/LPS O-acetylase OafA/YrhL
MPGIAAPSGQREAAVPTRLGYIPALDGLRGVAIALVIARHVGWLGGGFLGVDIFFVLSGFLITTLLLEEWGRDRAVSLSAFYWRRARRLLPAVLALLAILGAIAAYCASIGLAVALTLTSIAATFFYAANIWIATGHGLIGPLVPMWSLAQEEQFYVLWPPLLVLLLHRGVSARRLASGLALAAVAVMLWRAHLGPGARSYYAPDTRSDPLLIGCLLAVLRHHLPRIPILVAALAGAALTVDVALASTSGGFANMLGYPLAGISTAVLIAAALQDSPVTRLLQFRPLILLGVISYGLYVWQGFVFANLRGLPGIAVALLVALFSYRYIEQPFRRRRAAPGHGPRNHRPSVLLLR